jgi:hypothetical protein
VSNSTTAPTPAPEPPARERFDWLRNDRAHLRGNLRDVERAIRSGQVGAADALELTAILTELQTGGGLTARERSRIGRILIGLADGPAAKVEVLTTWFLPGGPPGS